MLIASCLSQHSHGQRCSVREDVLASARALRADVDDLPDRAQIAQSILVFVVTVIQLAFLITDAAVVIETRNGTALSKGRVEFSLGVRLRCRTVFVIEGIVVPF